MIDAINALLHYDFLQRALLAAILISLCAGVLGCLTVWQRMVYFGDALSHTALLGAALGIVMGLQLNLAIIITCILAMLTLASLERINNSNTLSQNTRLGILAHTALALALVLLSLKEDIPFDLYAFLFGDILAVSWTDLYWISGITLATGLTLLRIWHNLLSISLHPELAQIQGIPVIRTRLAFLLTMALFVAVAMKLTGIILTVSLLIIPAASARRFARTPEQMALHACLLALLASCFGLFISMHWDTPAGPAIILTTAAVFFGLQLIPRRQ